MPPLTDQTLKQAVRRIVQAADRAGEIDQGLFTIRLARERVARDLSVQVTDLSNTKWKSTFKHLVEHAIDELDEPTPPLRTDTKRPKPSADSTPQGTRPDQDQEQQQQRGSSFNHPHRKPKHKTKPTIVESDDSEPEPTTNNTNNTNNNNSDEENEEYKTEPDSPVKRSDETSRSESSSGSLLDHDHHDPPAKKRKRKDGQVEPPRSKASKRKTETSKMESSPDDERIKELKAIIVACGVRKQWAKELANCETPKSQINHLEGILRSLGMKGQLTRAKAKSIKTKREMEAELDDIAHFEAERGLGIMAGNEAAARRSRHTTTRNHTTYASKDVGSSDEESLI